MAGKITLRELITRWRFKTDEAKVTKFQRALGATKKVARGVGTAFGAMAKVAAAGFAATAAAAAVGIKKSIQLAADAEEAESKFEATFVRQAKNVRAWSEKMGKAINRSAYDLRDQAASYGDLFSALGFTGKASANLSTHLVKLTQDLSSFRNEDPKEVLIALKSGLIGNMEPVLKYGAIINAAAVNQELLNMGIKGGAKRATEQQKVMARLNIIMRATKKAHGDAARTSGSWTNMMRGLEAAVKDVMIMVGARLIPALKPYLKIVMSAVSTARAWTSANKELLDERVALLVRALAEALQEVHKGLKMAFGEMEPGNIKEMTESIADLIIGLGHVAKWLIVLGKFSWDGTRAVMDGIAWLAAQVVIAFDRIWTHVVGFWNRVTEPVESVKTKVGGLFGSIRGIVMMIFGPLSTYVAEQIGEIGESVLMVASFFRQLNKSAMGYLSALGGFVRDWMGGLPLLMLSVLEAIAKEVVRWMGGIKRLVMFWLSPLLSAIEALTGGVFTGLEQKVRRFFGSLMARLRGLSALDIVGRVLASLGGAIATAFRLGASEVTTFFTGILSWLASLPAAIWSAIVGGFQRALGAVLAQVNALKGKLGKVGGMLFGSGGASMPAAMGAAAPVAAGAGGGGQTINVTNQNTINVPPGTPASMAQRVGDSASKAQTRAYRRGITDARRQ